VRRFALRTRKSQTKTRYRLANGQRVTSLTVCDITFELGRHEFQRTFYVLHDLRAADLVLGLPWLDDDHASLQSGTTCLFTQKDETAVETQIEERLPHCLLMSSCTIQNSCTRRAAVGVVTLNFAGLASRHQRSIKLMSSCNSYSRTSST
jgi:hypothetical protein